MKYIIPHPLQTSEQMRAETKRRLDAGLPLGALHDYHPLHEPTMVAIGALHPQLNYSKLLPSQTGRWNFCNGFSRK